jgi:hypothetical protein
MNGDDQEQVTNPLPPEAERGVGEINRRVGAMMLELLRRWDGWVHRRVEAVEVKDPATVRRHATIDFTLLRGLGSPIEDGAGQKIYFVPLAFLAKQPLTNLDLRDETGRALPVLTKRRNAALAASLLVSMAEAGAPDELIHRHGAQLPESIVEQIWRVAGDALPLSRPVAERFAEGTASDGDTEAETAWREQLRQDQAFVEMAQNLAGSFILAVPLAADPGVRRIIKFTYEELGNQPEPALPSWLKRLAIWAVRKVSGPRQIPLPGDAPRERGWRVWLKQAVGLGPIVFEIEAPAVMFGGSYHLEFVAPEGLQITRAEMQPRVVAAADGDEEASSSPVPIIVRRRLERVHLYLSETPDQCVGADAYIYLRPRPWTIVRTAWLVSGLTLALMILVTAAQSHLVGNLGPALSFLLIIPGLIGSFVARGGEPSPTTHAMFGLRLVGAGIGIWPLAAGITLALGTSCTDATLLFASHCDTGWLVPWLLVLFTVASAAMCALLGAVMIRIWRPPEQREP